MKTNAHHTSFKLLHSDLMWLKRAGYHAKDIRTLQFERRLLAEPVVLHYHVYYQIQSLQVLSQFYFNTLVFAFLLNIFFCCACYILFGLWQSVLCIAAVLFFYLIRELTKAFWRYYFAASILIVKMFTKIYHTTPLPDAGVTQLTNSVPLPDEKVKELSHKVPELHRAVPESGGSVTEPHEKVKESGDKVTELSPPVRELSRSVPLRSRPATAPNIAST